MTTQQRYRMPAEWEPHEAMWLSWPHNPDDWPGKIVPVYWAFADMIKKAATSEPVYLVVRDAASEQKARRMLERSGADMQAIRFFRIPSDRGWMRDTGPIAVYDEAGRRAIAGFDFTAWAKYDNYALDASIASLAAQELGIPLHTVTHQGRHVVLEGGAIDVNGRGTLITTEECMLHPTVQVRNPGFSRADYEQVFAASLGVTATIWLKDGIAGDDTHGHVDDLCRFTDERTIVLCSEDNPADPNYRILNENKEILQSARLQDGHKPEVVLLPMPRPVVFDGQRLPASYANFYIGNTAVLVPTFNDENDYKALGILAELFPGRRIIGIHAVDLVWGLGTVHCLSQQLPKA